MRRIVLRGLLRVPEERFPSMDALLEALGDTVRVRHRRQAALAGYQQALALREKAARPEHPDLVVALVGLGRGQVALGAPREALAPLERALKLSATPRILPETSADLRFGLARALWETNGDRERARRLATEAREAYARVGRTKDVRAVAAWLAGR